MPTVLGVILAIAGLLIGGVGGYFAGYTVRKKTAESKIGSAETESQDRG